MRCRLAAGTMALVLATRAAQPGHTDRPSGAPPPNILLVLADQWRFETFGYADNPDVKTPDLDRLHREGICFVNAVSGMPVCSPMHASFLTGQRPLTHGVFLNDVALNPAAMIIAKVLRMSGR